MEAPIIGRGFLYISIADRLPKMAMGCFGIIMGKRKWQLANPKREMTT
jgi:hypothetical protein